MGLIDLIAQIVKRPSEGSPTPPTRFVQVDDSDGINFVVADGSLSDVEEGHADPAVVAQFVALVMLEEQGLAERFAHGFRVGTEAITRCDESIAEVLDLPPVFDAPIDVAFDSHTNSASFRAYATTTASGREVVPKLRGGLITVAGSRYRATPPQQQALQAIALHDQLDARDEAANVELVGALLGAAKNDSRIRAAHFTRGGWSVAEPPTVGVRGHLQENGDLVLAPALDADVDNGLLDRRWGQLEGQSARGILRVENHIISLDEIALSGVREVLEHRHIPAAQVKQFLKTPSAFLDAALVDLDLGFSVRVEGVGVVQHIDFSGSEGSSIDWFQNDSVPAPPSVLADLLKSTDDINAFDTVLAAALVHGATALNFSDRLIDISDPDAVYQEINAARARITNPPESLPRAGNSAEPKKSVALIVRDAEALADPLERKARNAIDSVRLDSANLARTPFPHQVTGIEWILGLITAAHAEDQEDLYRLQGGLLADDMGLGKTFMALSAIGQYMATVREAEGAHKVKPTLVVAPLSLLENWEAEVTKTFTTSPFTDVIVLQSQRDLKRFRRGGHGRETTQLASLLDEDSRIAPEHLRLALRVGSEEGTERLDRPGRLVLTTYDTLRDYQLSMAQIDWGVVVFDEAQAIKNPNAVRTRAAKGLRSTFKLVTTGTPVENSLGDFWCLVDTAQPGLLGDWVAFRDTWVTPVLQVEGEARDQLRTELGRGLRSAVGSFMLRRVKEDHLEGLPKKYIHTPFSEASTSEGIALARIMPPAQQRAYDEILRTRAQNPEAPENNALAALVRLRAVSLHPELGVHGARPAWPDSAQHAARQLTESGKLLGLTTVLDGIRQAGEKVIIFAMSKDLQLLLSLWVTSIYGVRPSIINGDTVAVSNTSRRSRRQLIEDFEAAEGFNVIIMSPIAAGTGLTVVAANHVVHLERHWNPAKEAQATDRAHRIGQTRDVHVYYPASIHPERESFDVLIDRLLASKVTVKDAVMEQGEVTEADMSSVFEA